MSESKAGFPFFIKKVRDQMRESIELDAPIRKNLEVLGHGG